MIIAGKQLLQALSTPKAFMTIAIELNIAVCYVA